MDQDDQQQGPTFGDAEGLTFGALEGQQTPQDRPEGVPDASAGAGAPPPPVGQPQDLTERLGLPGLGAQAPEASLADSLAGTEDMQGSVTDAIEDVMRPMLKKAFERQAQGDKVNWTIMGVMIPHPQNPAMGMAVPVIYIETPAAILGNVVTQNIVLQQFAGFDQEAADDVVRQGLEACRQQRTAQMDQLLGANDHQNGQGHGRAPGGGLILP